MEKKELKLLLCALAIGLCVSLANADIETGLTGYWSFAEGSGTNAADLSGGGNDGTLTNGPIWADGPVGSGGSISFDGYDDFVNLETFNPTNTNEITIALWAYCEGIGASNEQGCMVAKRTTYDTTLFQFIREKDGSITMTRPNVYSKFTTSILPLSTWKHIVFTCDASGVSKLYFDGVLDANLSWVVAPPSDVLAYIGMGWPYHTYPHQPWYGMLDEVRFYDRAITADDVMELFEYASDPTFNISPRVDAGDYQSLLWETPSVTAQLDATATDDGRPYQDPPADPCTPVGLTLTWSKTSGPGTVVFSDATIEDPTATFDAAGVYELQLRGYDGENDSCDVVTISVRANNDPIAYWDFDEGLAPVNDDSANNNEGTLTGNSEPNWVSGWVGGGALEFYGETDPCVVQSYVDIATDGTIDPNLDSLRYEITLSVWMKTTEVNTIVVADGDNTWRMGMSSHQIGKLYFVCEGLTGSTLYTEGLVNDGYWHHVAAVYDGSTASLYVDGVLDSSSERTGLININDLPVTIGARYDDATTASYSFNGMLDDVRVYSYGLSADQVAILAAMAPLVPVVDVGEDQTYAIQRGPLQLDATVADDGKPAAATLKWTADPCTVVFSDDTIEDPIVTFPEVGTYVLRLTANDTMAVIYDEVTITVVNPTCQDIIDDGLLIAADISGPDGTPDCYINLYDFAAIAGDWLYCNDPQDPGCEFPY